MIVPASHETDEPFASESTAFENGWAARSGIAHLDGTTFKECSGIERLPQAELEAFRRSWDDLGLDGYMADGGRYRRRRHSTFAGDADGGPVRLVPHQPHYQDRRFNELNGGVARHFEPIQRSIVEHAAMQGILRLGSSIVGACMPATAWHIEAHQFRIEAVSDGGKPTPEGIHRDGVDFVLISLIERRNVRGGSTTIQTLDGDPVATLTLRDAFESVLLDDRRVAHGVSPITAVDRLRPAYRDALVVTFRRLS